jgi:hypothetical protein
MKPSLSEGPHSTTNYSFFHTSDQGIPNLLNLPPRPNPLDAPRRVRAQEDSVCRHGPPNRILPSGPRHRDGQTEARQDRAPTHFHPLQQPPTARGNCRTTKGGWNPTTECGQHTTSKGECENDLLNQPDVPADSPNHATNPPSPNKTKHTHANGHGGRATDNMRRTSTHAGAHAHSEGAQPNRARDFTPNTSDRGERSKRNSIATASRKRIASLIRAQIKRDQARPRNSTNERTRQEAPVVEPQFTYNFSNPKGNPVPTITQEEEPPPPKPLSNPKRRSRRINGSTSPRSTGIYAAALHHFMGSAFLDKMKRTIEVNDNPLDPQEMANGVVYSVTKETITKYKKLIDDPLLRDVWSKAMCKELGRLTRGVGKTKGTDTIRFMELRDIGKIPQDRVVTYARIVVDYRVHKKDPNRVRITAGGNLLKIVYPGELTTRTSDLTTSKCMWSNGISIYGARYMCGDASDFYLDTLLERNQYMRIPIKLIPQEFIDLYQLQGKVKKVSCTTKLSVTCMVYQKQAF